MTLVNEPAAAAVHPIPVGPVSLAVGDSLPERRTAPLTRTDFVRYAGAGGDFNPIHHDEPFAQAARLPSVFAMGMLPAGMLGLELARWVGPPNVRQFGVRFAGQVWPGDELTLRGSVDQIVEVDGAPAARIALSVTRQGGEVVLTGRALAIVSSQE